MKYKAVFFDFDGTLMDTSEGIFESGRHALSQLGFPIPEDAQWRRFIGPPLAECFTNVFGITDKNTLDQLCCVYRKYYHAEAYKKASFYPGILDVIQALRKRGYIVALASMKNTVLINKMLEYFEITNLFDGVFGLNLEGTNTKADCLRDGFKKFNLKSSDCILVGDTEYDEHGAAEAQCDCIKVDWGFGYTKNQKGTISSAEKILELV